MEHLTPTAAAILLDVCTRASRRGRPCQRARRARRAVLTSPVLDVPAVGGALAPLPPQPSPAIASILGIVGRTTPSLAANERYVDFLRAQSPARIAAILHNTRTMLGGVSLSSASAAA